MRGGVQLGDEGRQFLAEGDRRGVHEVRASGLEHPGMAFGLDGQPVRQLGDRG
jgi:hypothetical protein